MTNRDKSSEKHISETDIGPKISRKTFLKLAIAGTSAVAVLGLGSMTNWFSTPTNLEYITLMEYFERLDSLGGGCYRVRGYGPKDTVYIKDEVSTIEFLDEYKRTYISPVSIEGHIGYVAIRGDYTSELKTGDTFIYTCPMSSRSEEYCGAENWEGDLEDSIGKSTLKKVPF